MNTKLKIALVALGICSVVAVVGVARLETYSKQLPSHVAILVDRSGSARIDPPCIDNLAKKAIAQPALGSGSTLSLILTGDRSTANEPILIAEYAVPSRRKVFEKRGELARQQSEILNDLESRVTSAPRAASTPLFVSIRGAIEHLRNKGCGRDSKCVLFVESDLEETVESGIRVALTRAKKPNLPPAINNDGITVNVFGIGGTNGLKTRPDGSRYQKTEGRSAQSENRIREVWSKLFTDSQRVTFDALCPKQ